MRSILLATLFAILAVPARAQTADVRWEPWLGCWELAGDNLRGSISEDGLIARAPMPASLREGAPRVCVTRTPDGARFETTVFGQAAVDQTIVADAASHPLSDAECAGTRRDEWSKNGMRLFSSAELTCRGEQGQRRLSGISLIAPNGNWLDIQAISVGGLQTVRVKRYYRAAATPASQRLAVAATRLALDEIVEASSKVPAGVLELALVETNTGHNLTARTLLDLDDAGVSDSVIDLLVALSYPERFTVERRSAPARMTFVNDPFLVGWAFGYPYFYDSYYYSPYYYSPFGVSSRGYDVFVSSVVSGSVVAQPVASGSGRVVDGLGYTRVRPRDAASAVNSSDVGVLTSSSSGRTVSSSGYSQRSSSSSSGSSDSGGSSSGGSSSSSSGSSSSSSGSSSGSSDTGRTAVPR